MKYIGIPRQLKNKAERIRIAIGVVLMVALIFLCIVGAGSLFSDRAQDTSDDRAPSDTAPLSSVDIETELPQLEHRSSDEPQDVILPLETEPEDDEDAEDDEELDASDEDNLDLQYSEVEEIATFYATGTLNVRSGPGVDYEQIDEYAFGDTVSVIASTDNGWKKIADDQYVIADYLSTQIPEQEHTGTYYATGNINVRSGPGTEYDITRELNSGSPISVVAKTANGWYRTAVDTYVYAELCTSTPPATPTPIATPTPTPIPIPPGIQEQAAAVGLSPEHFEFVARVVRAESNGTSYEGKVWVAQVIWNRVNSGRWPNTAFGVVTQSGQFSVVSYDSANNQYVCNASATSDSRRAVVEAFQNPPIPRDIIYFNNQDNFSHEYYGEKGGNHFYYG